jgi:hypothetical protein
MDGVGWVSSSDGSASGCKDPPSPRFNSRRSCHDRGGGARRGAANHLATTMGCGVPGEGIESWHGLGLVRRAPRRDGEEIHW